MENINPKELGGEEEVTKATAPQKNNTDFRTSTTASKTQEPRDVRCQTSTDPLCRVEFVPKGKTLN